MAKIGAGHLEVWLNNGLQELQSAVSLGSEQVQAGNNPGLVGTVLPQEAMLTRQESETPAPMVVAGENQKQEPEQEM